MLLNSPRKSLSRYRFGILIFVAVVVGLRQIWVLGFQYSSHAQQSGTLSPAASPVELDKERFANRFSKFLDRISILEPRYSSLRVDQGVPEVGVTDLVPGIKRPNVTYLLEAASPRQKPRIVWLCIFFHILRTWSGTKGIHREL